MRRGLKQHHFSPTWLALALFALAANGYGAEAPAAVTLGFDLYGNSVDSAQVQSRIAGLEVEGGLKKSLGETLKASLQAAVQLEAGSAQSTLGDEFSPRQSLKLREAAVAWTPFSWLKLRAGALNQDLLRSPLLFQKQTFPALEQSAFFYLNSVRFEFAMEQAVPNDTSTRQPWTFNQTSVPQFYLERLSASVDFKEWTGSFWGSHFLYRDLASPTAFQAQFRGNSITGKLPANSNFQYEFQGFEIGTTHKVPVYSWANLVASGNWVANSQAPAGRNRGWKAVVGAETFLSANYALVPQWQLFNVESDAVPALFNDRVFGQTNRQGWGARLDFILQEEKTTLSAEYVSSQTVQASALQSDLHWFQLHLRSQYDWL